MNAPLVSIGMPVYNGAPFIREALDAILSQTFKDFELIISDNASTDGTEAIGRDYAARDERIRYIRERDNRGPNVNFRAVLDEAVGEYFMWAAADDKLGNPITLAKLVEAIRHGFELAIPDVDLANETGTITQKGVLSSIFLRLGRQSFQEVALRVPSYQVYGLFSTSSLRKYWHFLNDNADLRCFGEGVFVHAVSHNMKCTFVDDALLIYRRHGENASSTVEAPILLRSYLVYTGRVISFYARSALALGDKIRYLSIVGRGHIPYTSYLIAASGKHYLRSVFRNLRATKRPDLRARL